MFDLLALVAIALGGVLTAVGLPTWLWALLSLVVAARPGVALVWAGRRLLAARAIERRIDEAVADYAPEFFVYTARPDDASYQVQMWLPYLERTGRRFVIIARTNVAARAIMATTTAPVITRRSLSDLDRLIPPSLRAVFYVNASSGNGAMVRYQQLTHVYLGHGDSDKPPSYNPTHAMYDKVFCAGPAAIDRYGAHGVDIPRGKFEIVGRPQVESVRPAEGPGGVHTVLYAPTWRGHVSETLLYSLPQGESIVRALLARGLTVIFRPHPFSHDFPEDAVVVRRIEALLAADAVASGRAHVFGAAAETEHSIVECINTSDAMISDVSSVVSDYLFSGKPFALIAVPTTPEQFVREFPVAEGSYVVDARADEPGRGARPHARGGSSTQPSARRSATTTSGTSRPRVTRRTSWTAASGCSIPRWAIRAASTTRWTTAAVGRAAFSAEHAPRSAGTVARSFCRASAPRAPSSRSSAPSSRPSSSV